MVCLSHFEKMCIHKCKIVGIIDVYYNVIVRTMHHLSTFGPCGFICNNGSQGVINLLHQIPHSYSPNRIIISGGYHNWIHNIQFIGVFPFWIRTYIRFYLKIILRMPCSYKLWHHHCGARLDLRAATRDTSCNNYL